MGVGAETQAVNQLTAQDNGSPDRTAPIDVFDSGVGRLIAACAIMSQLPHESIMYIGDTANGPYGPLRITEVRQHAEAITDEPVACGCKMIVITCNTASAALLRDARECYPVPVVEVILPAVRRAVSTTKNGKVDVIGTAATIRSHAYQDLFDAVSSVDVSAVDCPRFVDFIERGIISGRQIPGFAEGYLTPLQADGVDTLVLGCIHYPLLSGVIQLAMGEDVILASSAEETSKDVLRILIKTDMLADPESNSNPVRTFESTRNPQAFVSLAKRFLGPGISQVTMHSQM